MNFLERVRKISFWGLDLIGKQQVRKHLDEITNHIEKLNLKEKQNSIQDKLEKLINHSLVSVPFYKNCGFKKIQDFPVINKNTIRDNFKFFKSELFSESSLYSVVTSGSTGTPFTVLQNKDKKKRNSADTIYFSKIASYELGYKLLYLKIWNQINKKSNLRSKLENIIPIDVTDLSDQQIAKILTDVEGYQGNLAFLGYASAFDAICNYITKNGIAIKTSNVKAIIAMSEALSQNTKEKMSSLFKAPMVSRYSNVENGILAQQNIDGSHRFLINSSSYFIEVLALDSDKPVKEGEHGRIVLTDLYNYGMPIIRYDTGDVGVKISDDLNEFFQTVEGRKMDVVFNTSGTLMSSFTITNNMWKYTKVRQYQFVQLTKKKYLFKLNTLGNKFDRELELIEEFKSYFGVDAIIDVEYVNEIPLLNSGKRRKVVNLIS